MPEPSAYSGTSPSPKTKVTEDDDSVSISSYGSRVDTHRTHQQDPMDPFLNKNNNDNNGSTKLISPGYKMENETRRIGGFDPEAFRKANQPKQASDGFVSSYPATGFNDAWSAEPGRSNGTSHGTSNGTRDPNTWVSPAAAATTHGGNMGGNAKYNGDYIPSQDIFTTDSPQALMQNSRVDIADPHHDIMGARQDPFGATGHQPEARTVNAEDDALMDDILGELDDL